MVRTALVITTLLVSASAAADTSLYDWNDPGTGGTTWPGWTYYTDTSGFGERGWRRNDWDSVWWMPRVHEKTDYGQRCSGTLETTDRPPSISSGTHLHVKNDGGTDKSASYWYLFKDSYGTLGKATSTTDRMTFWYKAGGFPLQTWINNPPNFTVHLGTYLCWPGAGLGGEDCPVEAAGHHYYHFLIPNSGAWLRVQMDRHPQHIREVGPPPPANPAAPRNYYEYMPGFYLEQFINSSPDEYWVDEISLSQTTQNENETSIASVWVGYWSGTGKWEIGFMDSSWSTYNDSSVGTYEIRWSTSPITNENFASATQISPEYHEYGTTDRIRRPDSWKQMAWTRFDLPAGVEAGNSTIYFALKDVSATANGDGHNAPSSYIRTISYPLSTVSVSYTVTPSAGANGTISPNTAQTVNSGSTTAFTVTPNSDYTASVGGTCGGALVGTTYTTSAITADCTVAATFTSADTVPPVLFGLGPASPLPTASVTATLALTTDEAATCRYSTAPGTDYASMTAFSATGGTTHSATVSVARGRTDWWYIRCQDASGNQSAQSIHRLSVSDAPRRRGSR